jgi:[ribosomal protein S18]-alanine N-acetyltransferase
MHTPLPCSLIALARKHIDTICLIDKNCFADSWLKRTYINEISAPCALNRVAVDPTEHTSILGFCLGRVIADEYTIHRLAVHPYFHRRGIATHMLRMCMENAARADATRCFVEVRADNTIAQQLYLNCGFERTGVRRAYYQPDAEDALLMQCDLAAALDFTQQIPEYQL